MDVYIGSLIVPGHRLGISLIRDKAQFGLTNPLRWRIFPKGGEKYPLTVHARSELGNGGFHGLVILRSIPPDAVSREKDADNQRLLAGVASRPGEPAVLLGRPRVEPINNRAERVLRPAVIARKVSHCPKTGEERTPLRVHQRGTDPGKKRHRCPRGGSLPRVPLSARSRSSPLAHHHIQTR
jgi:hypothetical protein